MLLLLTIAICGYLILINFVRYGSVEGSQTVFFVFLITGLKVSLFFGGLLSVFFLMNHILWTEMRRGIALTLLFFVGVSSVLFGYHALSRIEQNNSREFTASSNWLVEKNSFYFPGGAVYLENIGDDLLETVVLYHHSNRLPNPYDESGSDYTLVERDADNARLSFIPAIPYNVHSPELIIDLPNGERIVLSSETIVNSRDNLMFHVALPVHIPQILTMLDDFAETFSLRYVVCVIAFFWFTFSTLLFLRLTRWPLINQVVTVLVIIGGLLLIRIHTIPDLRDFIGIFLSEQFMDYISAALLVFFALIFSIINALRPRIDDWYQDMNS